MTPALIVTVAGGAAFAEAPTTWESPPSISGLHVLWLLVLIPVGLFALITLLVYLPSLVRGDRHQPGQTWSRDPEWFGGPREGVEAATTTTDPSRTPQGGSSGRW